MSNQKIRAIGAAVLVVLWSVLTVFAWLAPSQQISEAERRPLAQFPQITADTLLSGDFMTDFEDYTLDQFPLRDAFRRLKSMFHYYVLQQKDNNGIYIVDGYAAEMEYPLNTESVDRAMRQYQKVYDLYLKDSGAKVYNTVIPDKGYYLAQENGYLSMDYETLFATVRAKTPWAAWIGIEDCLQLEDYYYTDTHWRQERILPVAERLCSVMQVQSPTTQTYTPTAMERPFYGVYYGQAALPMEPEIMYLMESDLISQCTVYNHATGKTTPIYDPAMLESKDQYDVFLGGAQSLLTVENPNATTDRELIIFRDSFGSSLAPLLLQGYKSVTLVDIRYIQPEMLGRFVEFYGQDVLFMYSALVLNKSLI